jgi:N-methylhydantoinase B
MRLYDGGRLNEDVERLIAANSREAETVLGDLRSQVGAVRIGCERMAAMAREQGAATIRETLAAMLEAAGREFRAALKRLPNGVSEADGQLDGNSVEPETPVRMHLRVTVKDGTVDFDFSKSDPQRRGPVNLRPALVESCCFQALIGLIDPDLRYCDSAHEVVSITTVPGTVVNALPPAPGSNYMKSCQKLIDVVFEALNPFCPERAAANTGGSSGSFTIAWDKDGPRRVRGNQGEIFGSAYGGANGQDGCSGTTVHLSNIYVTPIEIVEAEFPCRVTRFELIPDSGGDGQFRGGLSIRREYEMLQPGAVMYRGDHAIIAPRGIAGGADGHKARFVFNPGKPGEQFFTASCRVSFKAGDRFVLEAAGGGGYGDPDKRDPAARTHDREDGYVTKAP